MTHLVQVSRPQDALAFLRSEFPLANMTADRNPDGDIVAFTFVIGRSKQFCPVYGGGIDFRAVRLFRDCQVYARDKRKQKATGKLVKRVSVDNIFNNPTGWMK